MCEENEGGPLHVRLQEVRIKMIVKAYLPTKSWGASKKKKTKKKNSGRKNRNAKS